MVLFAVLGPGIITANADNDATGILGYAYAGAAFKYSMLWILIVCAFALGIAQEMCARMGTVTGKGLADLIREEFGVKITILAMAVLLVANFATTIAEFAGMLAAAQVFFPSEIRWVVIPIAAIAIWLLVTRGSYRKVEQMLLMASFIYLAYIASAVMSHPNWGQVFRETFSPHLGQLPHLRPDLEIKGQSVYVLYIFVAINVIGTTITPWGQFYVQSAVRDKGIKVEEYGYERFDVIFGAMFTNFIAFSIMVCCGATLFASGIHDFENATQVAIALKPLAGPFAMMLFAIGLFNASCFGAIVVPLSTAYAITEALGSESGLGRRTREAPLFIGVFTFLIVSGAVIVMLFPNHLTTLMILPNIVGGILMPIILVLMQLLINKRRIMGHYVNGSWHNRIAWGSTIMLTILAVAVVVTQLLQMLH